MERYLGKMENTTFGSTELEFCKFNVNCESIDKDLFKQTENEIIDKLKRVKLKGFRKGKVSEKDVKISLRKEIKEQLKIELASKVYFQYLNKNNVSPIGYPSWSNINMVGDKFTCNFVVHTKPPVNLTKYKEFELQKPQTKPASDISAEILQNLRQKVALQEPFSETDVVAMGDKIMVDFTASVENENISDFKGENELITVGQSPLPEFDANLIGMKVGESKSFTVLMPKSTDDKISEKQVQFNLTVNMGTKYVLPALDDAFAKQFGLENYEALIKEVENTSALRAENSSFEEKKKLITSKLLESNEVQIPEWLIDVEFKHQLESRYKKINLNDEDALKVREACAKNIKQSLILEKIASEEPDAQISDAEVIQKLQQQVQATGQDFNKFMKNAKENYQLPLLFAQIKDEFILNWVVSTCSFNE